MSTNTSCLDEVRTWLAGYVTQPHDDIGRPGAICPFVEPSMRVDALTLREWPVTTECTVTELLSVIDRMAEAFLTSAHNGGNAALHAVVVALPGLVPERHRLLDEAHATAKTGLVRRGLMLGQFHPTCDERAARNERFPVSRSPLPLLAIRHMAFHDVLFLSDDREWFDCYRDRFGHRFENAHVHDPLFVRLYAQANDRWPLADRAVAPS
ncbi:DUF6875 domain-containing protein [Actinophytocola oryzae]|uniref:DUF6875 domain-containing protein n=1 Tax=Actinophytocola oryzae TaxID=502181 RepID=A0A4R7W6T3_9PSEU|nr:hypothetical protein [Actinophytocola oryzae]TDV57407.1 hypothetical protein CLV71_101278 [Actinophytocola oryzae]